MEIDKIKGLYRYACGMPRTTCQISRRKLFRVNLHFETKLTGIDICEKFTRIPRSFSRNPSPFMKITLAWAHEIFLRIFLVLQPGHGAECHTRIEKGGTFVYFLFSLDCGMIHGGLCILYTLYWVSEKNCKNFKRWQCTLESGADWVIPNPKNLFQINPKLDILQHKLEINHLNKGYPEGTFMHYWLSVLV